ncbi:TPA: hypothetical protein DIV45_00255 [Patescibacteria group bacterium]|nr:hypothetical protein [Patescibacteria group bacterium]
MADKIQNLDEFVQKVDAMKKENKLDLSSDQDLSIAIMNLVSLEEHFFFTAAKTDKTKYYDFIGEIREMRKSLMQKIVKNPEGEIWCISKHLLAASMRLLEVGNKQLNLERKEEAYDLFQKSYQLYNLFWGLNMNLIDVGEIKKIDEGALNKSDTERKGFLGKLGDVLKKALDCCRE